MATRRMISDLVLESDEFLELALSSQALYSHIILSCDNWGFSPSVNRIKRMIGASDEDVQNLVDKGFLIRFPGTPVCCVTHWFVMNSLKDSKGKSEFPEMKQVRRDGGLYVLKNKEDYDED